MVEAAEEPAAPHLVLDIVNALPRRLRTGAVGDPKGEAGDDLDAKAKREGAAPDVTPTRAAGDVFVECLVDEFL